MTTTHTSRHARLTRAHRLPRLLAGATAMMMLVAACGDDDDTVVSTSDGGAPPVIHLGSAPAAAPTALGADAATVEGGLSRETSLAPAFITEFEVVGELPALDTPAQAWTLDGAGVDVGARLAEIAAVFGVDGEPRQLPADQGGGWSVGSADYTGPTIYASDLGELYWGYSLNATVSARVACAEPAVTSIDAIEPAPEPGVAGGGTDGDDGTVGEDGEIASDGTGETMPGCEQPSPPEGVTSADDALARTQALFADLGLDESQYRFEAFGDEYYRSVNANLVLDGFATGLSFGVGFGEGGRIEYANGFLAQPVPVAEYPRIGTTAAVERLGTQQGSYYPYPLPLIDGGGVAILESTDSAVAGSSGAVEAPVAGGGARGDDASDGAAADAPASDTTAPATTPLAAEPPSPDTPVDKPADGSSTPGFDPGSAPPAAPSCAPDTPECVDVIIEDPFPVPVEPVVVTLERVEEILTPIWDAQGTVWLLPGYRFFSTDGGQWDVIAIDDEFIDYGNVGVPVPLSADAPVADVAVDADGGVVVEGGGGGETGEAPPTVEPQPAVGAPEPVTTIPEGAPGS